MEAVISLEQGNADFFFKEIYATQFLIFGGINYPKPSRRLIICRILPPRSQK